MIQLTTELANEHWHNLMLMWAEEWSALSEQDRSIVIVDYHGATPQERMAYRTNIGPGNLASYVQALKVQRERRMR